MAKLLSHLLLPAKVRRIVKQLLRKDIQQNRIAKKVLMRELTKQLNSISFTDGTKKSSSLTGSRDSNEKDASLIETGKN